jgi:HK97 family phage prohead protease
MDLEIRAATTPPEIRESDNGGKVAAGYAAVFGSQADIGDSFAEVIAPGAFADTLDADVIALIGHDRSRVLGRTKSGTLRLREDDKGLYVEIDLPDTSDGRDLAIQLERRDVSGMSFGFRVTHDEWDETGQKIVRTIHKVELLEVSATAFPAYPDTSLALRSLDAARKEARQKNHDNAARRIAARKASAEQRFRKIV